MDKIVNWIKSIACFYIIGNYIESLISNEKYRKYVHLFLGIVMMILVISPVFEFCRNNLNYKTELPEIFAVKDIEVENQYASKIYEIADKQINTDISVIVEKYGIKMVDCIIYFEKDNYASTGLIAGLKITVESTSEPTILMIKKDISDFYNLSLNNINVNIQKERELSIG